MKFWPNKKQRSVTQRDPALLAAYGVTSVSSGVTVTPETAKRICAVYACVQAIADTISTLPIHIYRRVSDGKEIATNDYRYDLLHYAPNRFQNSEEWRDVMLRQFLLTGRGCSQILTDTRGRVTELLPIPTRDLAPSVTPDGIAYKISDQSGRSKILLGNEVLDFRGGSLDGVNCLSPIKENEETLGLAIAGSRYAGKFFKNGASPSGILKSKTQLNDASWNRLKEAADRIKGLEEAHGLPVFEEDIDWINVNKINPEDAQLLETRQYSVTDIARIFRVPPHKIGDLSRSTFSNIEQQNIDWVVDGLLPRIVKFEKAIDKAIFLDAERGKLFTKIDVRGLLRGDSQTRANYYRTLSMMGVLSVNEIREMEELNPVPDGDQRFRQLNMIGLGEKDERV